MADFITAYRPKTLEEVVGQETACKAIENAITERRASTFILEGPSGTGKTTLARIAASLAKCGKDVLEIDAATNSGIEAMRAVQDAVRYRAIGGGNRACIIDEAHGLSKQAFDSLLKALEEPRPGLFWFLCTTDGRKIPKTLQTRALKVNLKPVKANDIERIVMKVVKAEKLPIGDGALDAVISLADGSPRQALSNLAKCADMETMREAREAIQGADFESPGVIELCRFLNQRGRWRDVGPLLEGLEKEGQSPEGIRIVVMNYFGKVARGAKDEGAAAKALDVLEAFCQPYQTGEGTGPLMLSIGRALKV